MENTKYGRRREGRWTPIRAKAQDTRANPNSWETHLVRKRWDIGLPRALSPRITMMMMIYTCIYIHGTPWCRGKFCALQPKGRGFESTSRLDPQGGLEKISGRLSNNCGLNSAKPQISGRGGLTKIRPADGLNSAKNSFQQNTFIY